MKTVYVINGPNMNLLGKREPNIYGDTSLINLENRLRDKAKSLNINIHFFQSNIEGNIIDKIQSLTESDYLIINPAAYSHTSIAIKDAISSVKCKAIEIHISNIHAREEFRTKSVTASSCVGVISGLGISGYFLALDWIINN